MYKKSYHVFSALEHKHGFGFGQDQTTPDMVKVRGRKDPAEEKCAKTLKAKNIDDTRTKKLAKKAATKGVAERSLDAHKNYRRSWM